MERTLGIFIILIAVISCKKEEVAPTKPGYFILTELKSPTLKNAQTDTVKTEFSLGDLKASKEYFFILSNGGDEPISDVEFISDNPAFAIFPEKISELAGADKQNSMLPLISLNVIHGIQLNGVGYADLLPMDMNSATITVTGKIMENGIPVEVKSTFTFSVNARVMDVRMFNGAQEIDLTKPSGGTSSTLGGLGFVRRYDTSSRNITLKNNGNVDIEIVAYQQDPQTFQMVKGEPVTLPKGNSLELTLQNGSNIFELDSEGTIADDERIQLGSNGKGYFGFYFIPN